MSKISFQIWERNFTLDLFFYEDSGCITKKQLETASVIAEGKLPDDSLDNVKEYICEHDLSGSSISEIDNVFKYVMPSYVYIPVSDNNEIVLLCNYKFDPEHGLAIKFADNKLKFIDKQD